MKKAPNYFGWISVLCSVMFLFNTCKKHDPGPGSMRCPPAAQWQLVEILWPYSIEINPITGKKRTINGMRHTFIYNADNLPVRHIQFRDPGEAEDNVRGDNFTYNNQCQLVQVFSENAEGPGSYIKKFTYGANNRKLYSLKYEDADDHLFIYLLTDSTVYRYQGNTIQKTTYHLKKGSTDTSTFVYDARQNLISAKLGEYWIGTEQLLQYDKTTNPAVHFNVESFEIDPFTKIDVFGNSEWPAEFLLMMQSPKFSRNNYRLRRNSVEYVYRTSLKAPGNLVDTIVSPRRGNTDVDLRFNFTYGPAN